MANPLHRMVSSSQVSEWFGQGTGILNNPSRIGKLAQGSGGTINTYVENGLTYFSHTFTSSGTFIAFVPLTVQYCVVAAGGGGNSNTVSGVGGGGAGAGGMKVGSLSITAGAKVVTVGTQVARSTQGNPSVFDSISCTGGGGSDAGSGGSGAGGGYGTNPPGGAGIAGQGHNGGSGAGTIGYDPIGSGGGGGKGGVGSNAPGIGYAGNGGPGLSNNYSTGSPVIYSAGGRGGAAYSGTGPAGVNPGDGGGGGNGSGPGTLGSAGIVIVRYVV